MIRPIGKQCHDLLRNRSGAVAIEFAILLPILISLYIGAVELSDAFAAKRKLTSATSAVGDLVTRAKDISDTEMDDILASAPGRVLYPYPAGDNLDIKVTCVAVDKDRDSTVKWSEGLNTNGDRVGSRLDLPDGVTLPDSKVVLVDMLYRYTPRLGAIFTSGDVELTSRFYFKPREANTVCYDGRCC